MSHASAIESGAIALDAADPAARFDDRPADWATEGGELGVNAPAIRTFCVAGAQAVARSGVDCATAAVSDRFPALPDPASISADNLDTAVGISAAGAVFDGAPSQSSARDLWLVSSGVSVDPKDNLVEVRDQTDALPWWRPRGDVYVRDAVPALGALALLVAGLLFFGIARRHLRSARARRIKRSLSQQRGPLRR